ncbi:preprotein translocase subunit SecE [Candidatus Babeliales bacterium]|nr:preprotein translocase subunit SecE [Candidatus Babeliales bacterium]
MKSMTQFFNEVRSEMAKVVWPTWTELVGSTIVVLIVVTAFSLYLGSVDYVISRTAEAVFTRYGIR